MSTCWFFQSSTCGCIPFFAVFIVCLLVSANELASVSPGLPSGSKPEVLDISAAAAADELRPR